MKENRLPDLEIVAVSEEHIESLYLCLDSVARERLYLAMVEAPPFESVKAFVQSSIANDVPHFVAIIAGEVVGWCDIVPMKIEGFEHVGRLGMGVEKLHRGRGIGRLLIERSIKAAKERGLERVELEVFASNTPAIKLYQKFGFVTEGLRHKARKLGDTYDDVILMARFL